MEFGECKTIFLFTLVILTVHLADQAVKRGAQRGEVDNSEGSLAKKKIIEFGEQLEPLENEYLRALWEYDLERSETNRLAMKRADKELRAKRRNVYSLVDNLNIITSSNDRELRYITALANFTGEEVLDDVKRERFLTILDTLKQHFYTVKVKKFREIGEHNLEEIMDITAHSRNEKELRHYFVQWYDSFDLKIKGMYTEYLDLMTEIATKHRMHPVEYWNKDYFGVDLAFICQAMLRKARVFYQQLHAYIRYRLYEKYGRVIIDTRGPLPIHLLGDLTGSSWVNIYKDTVPFPKRKIFNYTDYMQKKNFDMIKVARLANDFYRSINLRNIKKKFYKESIFEKPEINESVTSYFDCFPSVWDFQDDDDFRLRMCGKVEESSLKTLLSEMGKLNYKLAYQNLPYIFRHPVTEGFLEAIGHLSHLTMFSPRYLFKKKRILEKPTKEDRINYLYKLALDKLVGTMHAFAVERWRWDVLNGSVFNENLNKAYWKRRISLCGVKAPTLRTERTFDAGTIYEVISNQQTLKNFIGIVLAFQLHDNICRQTKYYKPVDSNDENSNFLHKCSLYGKTVATKNMRDVLSYGRSKPWFIILNDVVEQRRFNPDRMLRFFKPLLDWLIEENKKNKAFVGWRS